MMISHGENKSGYGPGVDIELTGNELAIAISAYLVSRNVNIFGPRTIKVNGELCEYARIYVDPSGYVISDGLKIDGRG